MKKLLLFLFALVSFVGTYAKTHTVARGESLQAIARSYGITVDELLYVNPDAGQLFFVGLKLEIPEKKPSSKTNSHPDSDQKLPENDLSEVNSGSDGVAHSLIPSNNTESPSPSTDMSGKRAGWDVLVEIDFGFLPSVEGVDNDFNFTLGVSVGASYWFNDKQKGCFASIAAGYIASSSGYKQKELQFTQTSDIWIVNLPIKFGYKVNVLEDKLHLTPYAGLDLGITVGGSLEQRMGTLKSKNKVETGKFVTGLRLGAQIGLGRALGLGGYYMIPLGDTAKAAYGKDGHFSLCVTCGF